jgi:hypothetical protein
MTYTCEYCRQPVHYKADSGWVHSNGGAAYMMKCDSCGHTAALSQSPVKCPACGSEKDWKDDHCVRAISHPAPLPV